MNDEKFIYRARDLEWAASPEKTIIVVDEAVPIDTPSFWEWALSHFRFPPKDPYSAVYSRELMEITCRGCRWKGMKDDLLRGESVEQHHPRNRGLGPNDPHLHATKYESCPRCARWLYADGQSVGRNDGSTGS